jgi:hypothetical protein
MYNESIILTSLRVGCKKDAISIKTAAFQNFPEGININRYTALGYSLVFFSLSYPAFHTGLSKGNAYGVLRLCRTVHNPDRGCLLITPYKRSAVRGTKTQNSTECSIIRLPSVRKVADLKERRRCSTRYGVGRWWLMPVSIDMQVLRTGSFENSDPVFFTPHPAGRVCKRFIKNRRKNISLCAINLCQ